MRVFSNGGGVQSTAALVLSAERKIDFPVHLFANVGEDSENPDTIDYVLAHALPYARAHGIAFEGVRRSTNNYETLYQRTLREEKSIGIPVRMANGAPGHRTCTDQFKRQVVHKYLGKGNHVVGLGISMDEFQRMRSDSGYANIVNEYPLIDLRLTRAMCESIIRSAGLPVPPKSSCWFCPFKRKGQWQEMRRTKPQLFDKAVAFETIINQKRDALGKDHVFLSPSGRPLDESIVVQTDMFDADDTCESGYCMT